MIYEIKRGSTVLAAIKPTGTRQEKVMGVDVVDMAFTMNYYVDFLKGDTTVFDGVTFYLEKPSDFENAGKWSYTLNFLSESSLLSNAEMLSMDETNQLTEYDCFMTGTADQVVDLIIANANRINPGWTKGAIDETEAKDFDFSGDNCTNALAKLAEAHNTEFWFSNKVIHLTKKGTDSGLSFKRGKGQGLIKLIRKTQDNKPVTRLRVFGSKQNLPTTYPGLSKRLRMPGGQLYIQDQAKVDKYGLIEDTLILEDVFPRRIGTVTAVTDAITFTDSNLNFNINDCLVDKVAAKVKFLTGQCAGYQFEIRERGFNNVAKTIILNVNKDERAIEVPSATGIKPAVGDQYILIDIRMPQLDITNAEVELKEKGTEKYYESSDPRVIFEAPTDRRYLRQYNITVNLGDFVTIREPQASIDKNIRVVSKTTNIQDKFDVTLELSENTAVASIVKQMIAQSNVQKAIKISRINDVARQRLMWRTTSELTTMLDTLRAEMLLIISEGGEYTTDVYVETSVDNNSNKFTVSTGTIDHEQYIENGGHWVVTAFSGIVPTTKAYYLYFKASKTSNAATVVYFLDKIPVDGGADYYFPFGILSSVINGTRIFSSTKGYTRITGNNITTGTLESPNGVMTINLETGEIIGKITFRSTSGAIKNITDVDVTANSALVQAGDAKGTANAAQNAANLAKVQADTALRELSDISNDSILDVSEKPNTLQDLRQITAEYPQIIAQANSYAISTTDYVNKYDALNTYLTPLLANMAVNSTIDRTNFILHFTNYFNSRQTIYTAVTNRAKQIADAAQSSATAAQTVATNAQSAATNAQNSATTANQLLADIANDNLLTPSEKQDILINWQVIQSEKPVVNASAATYSITTSAYDTAYNSLNSYVTPLLASMTTNTTIVATTFRSTFKAYYDAKVALLKLVSDAAKGLVDNIQVGGTNLLSGGSFEVLPVFETIYNCTPEVREEYGGIKAKIGSTYLFAYNLGWNTVFYFQMPKINITVNTQYTVSFYAIFPFATNTLNITLAYSNNTYSTIPVPNINTDGLWGKRSAVTFTTPAGVNTVAIRFDATAANWFCLDGLKMEVGNKAGDFSPSISDVQNNLDKAIGNIKIGGVNLLKNYTNLIFPSTDYPGGSSIAKTSSGSYLITTLTNLKYNQYRFIGADLSINIIGGKQYTVSIKYRLVNGNTFDFIASLAVFQSNKTLVQSEYLVATGANWSVQSLTFTTYDAGNIALIIGGAGYAGNTVEYSTIQIEEGNKATTIKPSPEDVASDAAEKANSALVQANAFADLVATTKANAAQANALSSASTDAQIKANNAYNTAVAASNTYANTVSNSAASTAQTAAAADASNKATQAYNNAVAAANAAYNNLTGALGPMAYRSVQLAAGQGVTVIDNGSVLTFLVDTAYVRANVINVGYITGLDLNFVKGTIGGILIQGNSIASSNGSFSVTSAGLLTASNANITGTINATAGNIAGFNISGDRLTKGQLNTPGQNYVNISPGSFQYQKSWPGGGGSNFEFNGVDAPGVNWAAAIGNGRVHDEINIALWLGAGGSSFRNIALKINEGDIQVGYDGDIGQTFIQNIGGGFGLKFVKGICVGAVRV